MKCAPAPRVRPGAWTNPLGGLDVTQRTCSIGDCERPATSRGWCSMHYHRWQRHGDPLQVHQVLPCAIEGCLRRYRSGGLCGMHLRRMIRLGSPGEIAPRRAPNGRGWLNASGYRMRYLPEHPLATNSGHVFEHRVALYEKIGAGEHSCWWCNRTVSWEFSWPASLSALVVDHLDRDRDNNAPENLVPSCQPCNVTPR